MKHSLKSTSIDDFLNKEPVKPVVKKNWTNPFYITVILTCLFLIGVFVCYKFRGEIKTTHAFVSAKMYKPIKRNGHTDFVMIDQTNMLPITSDQGEEFVLLLTDRLGETISVDDNTLWGKANKGDSVILYFHHSFLRGKLIVDNIKILKK